MFILLVNYKKPLEEVEENPEAHRAYPDKYYALKDPFYFKGIADYEIIEVIPTKYAEGGEKFFM